jgi:hypothetical protein
LKKQATTQTGVLFGFDWEHTALVVLGVLVVVLAAALVYSHRKRAKQPSSGGSDI